MSRNAPDGAMSATSSRIEFVPQSMAATRDMGLPYGRGQPASALGRLRPAGLRPGAHRGPRPGRGGRRAPGVEAPRRAGHFAGGAGARPARRRPPARAAHPRPPRQPHRRGRVPPLLARAAGFYRVGQLESGHCCPISMTYAAVPALRHDPGLAAAYEPGLRSTTYAFGLSPPATKAGLLAGMSMTEKQGGSDVRANTTWAEPSREGTYRLTGHKWFTSAPMNDLFLTLAQARGGLTCFVLPRVLPDGTRNGIRLVRLKDKLGNRSNASAEIEYESAVGWRLEIGRA